MIDYEAFVRRLFWKERNRSELQCLPPPENNAEFEIACIWYLGHRLKVVHSSIPRNMTKYVTLVPQEPVFIRRNYFLPFLCWAFSTSEIHSLDIDLCMAQTDAVCRKSMLITFLSPEGERLRKWRGNMDQNPRKRYLSLSMDQT